VSGNNAGVQELQEFRMGGFGESLFSLVRTGYTFIQDVLITLDISI